MSTKNWALALAAAIGLGTSASASTYTFDFTQETTGDFWSAWVDSVDVESNEDENVSVTASGAYYDGSNNITTGASKVATWENAGLGVKNGLLDQHRVDGLHYNDLAIFDLGTAYELTSIGFSYYDSAWEKEIVGRVCAARFWGQCVWYEYEYEWTEIFDNFDLFIDLGAGLQYSFSDLVDDTYTLSGGLISSSFGIGASGKYDAFKITSITVAAVPVPAAGFLLLGALGGLGLAARRRKG